MITSNLYLRALRRSDIERTTGWLNDPTISDIMGYLPVFTVEDQLKWFDRVAGDRSRFIFAICLRETDEHIGNVGLGNIDYIHRHAMLNLFIADPIHRGKGYGTEVLKEALRFAFNRLNLNQVHLRTSSRFQGAQQLYEKVGFRQEGVMRQHYFTDGQWEDKILYSILRSEYHE